jgi:hypothetical protein
MSNPESDDPVSQHERLKVVSAQTRLQSVQSQLALAFSFCAMAETELSYKNTHETQELIQKARRIAEVVTYHVAEPNHVPENQAGMLRNELERLESRISDIETRRSKLA